MSNWELQAAEAIYDGDTLRLHKPLPLDQQQRVWVIVMPIGEPAQPVDETRTAGDILVLAAQVYEGLSSEDMAEVERLALDRSHFFSGEDT